MASDNERDDAHAGEVQLLPLLPLRDTIVFPNMASTLFVGREKSILALEFVENDEHREVLLVTQKEAKTPDPGPDDIFHVGTIGYVSNLERIHDGNVKVVVKGRRRARIRRFIEEEDFLYAEVEEIIEPLEHNQEVADRMKAVRAIFFRYAESDPRRYPPDLLASLAQTDDPGRFCDMLAGLLNHRIEEKQRLLEMPRASERLATLQDLLSAAVEANNVTRKLRSRSGKKSGDRGADNASESGGPPLPRDPGSERDEFKNEIEELEERIQRKELPDEIADRVRREFKKLRMMSPMSAEATVVRNYVEWILTLPWLETTDEDVDLERAEATLDEEHYGLQKPKDRILEYLAVHKLVQRLRGPVLCLVGPPGVGKTSLARSIAHSINRRFVRLSLGGVRDEAEIRGHRRTYIGAMPGKIIQSLKKVGSNNPVLLLDEIDKMSMDFRGDPSSALLEVLDPEQNATFNDHYLDLDYDLSEVMFITTANNVSQIPIPLRDRMEVIEIPGYTEHEKLQIARNHLIERQRTQNGLADVEVQFSDAALQRLIGGYTREAGVRNLEREIGSVLRKFARDVVRRNATGPFRVSPATVTKLLGPAPFRDELAEETDEIGYTNGLAWTLYGGVLLTAEVTVMPGAGKLIITGKLGDVMQESAQAAMTYVRSRALNLGLSPGFYQKLDLHVHFPEGAAPKDGPSAGITMVTSLVSALTRIPVRHDVAMTGEITLRGRVLPIGGLKEKILAARRAGVTTVIIPADNEKDLRDIPKNVLRTLRIVPVRNVDEVLREALALEDADGFYEKLRTPIFPDGVIVKMLDEAATPPDTEPPSRPASDLGMSQVTPSHH